jgi:hypothetical protein
MQDREPITRVELPANSRSELPNGQEVGERSNYIHMATGARENGCMELDTLAGLSRRPAVF